MTDAEEIAKGLTEAEQEALLWTASAAPGEQSGEELGEAIASLLNARILGVKPTPLGLSVRAVLQEKG
jgi:hypothetical protein